MAMSARTSILKYWVIFPSLDNADYRNLTMATTTPTMAPVCIHKAR